ncbi:MAG TPA: hypothetical protein VGS19_26930 [Streptosporangiaceae bacterium]|nr:hypothetical protein [Streptosporangiaceae bacterium]
MSQPSLRSHAAAAQLHAAARTARAIAAQRDHPPASPSPAHQPPTDISQPGTPTQPTLAGSTKPPAPATETGLEAEFPGWHIWRTSDAGTWWASRHGPHWNTEPRTLAADTAEGLRAQLRAVPGTTGVQR